MLEETTKIGPRTEGAYIGFTIGKEALKELVDPVNVIKRELTVYFNIYQHTDKYGNPRILAHVNVHRAARDLLLFHKWETELPEHIAAYSEEWDSLLIFKNRDGYNKYLEWLKEKNKPPASDYIKKENLVEVLERIKRIEKLAEDVQKEREVLQKQNKDLEKRIFELESQEGR